MYKETGHQTALIFNDFNRILYIEFSIAQRSRSDEKMKPDETTTSWAFRRVFLCTDLLP
jgi:hypothetical protein